MMKKFFSRLLGNQAASNAAVITTPEPSAEMSTFSDKPIDKTLFVEEGAPHVEPKEHGVSGLEAFLSEDHFSKGVLDGYSQHSTEHMRKRVNAMAAGFRKLVQDEIEAYRKKDVEIRLHLTQVGEQFSEFRQQLVIRMEAGRETMELLEKQLMDSVELEGRVAAPIKAYEAGYEVGMRQYLEECGFLSSQNQ